MKNIKSIAIVMALLFGILVALPWFQTAVYADQLQVLSKRIIVSPTGLTACRLNSPSSNYTWSKAANSDGGMNVYYVNRPDKEVLYCIEPGVDLLINSDGSVHGGTYTWTSVADSYGQEYHTRNGGAGSIGINQIRDFIGKIIVWGYHGSADSISNNIVTAPNDEACHFIATQILIWETIVGERDENFNHLPNDAGGEAYAVKEHYLSSLYVSNLSTFDTIEYHYQQIIQEVQNWNKIPSFTYSDRSYAQSHPVNLDYDNPYFEASDTNDVFKYFAGQATNQVCTGNSFYLYGGANGDIRLTLGREFDMDLTVPNVIRMVMHPEYEAVRTALDNGTLNMRFELERANGFTEGLFYTCDGIFGINSERNLPAGTALYQDLAGRKTEGNANVYIFFKSEPTAQATGSIEVEKRDLWTGNNLSGAVFDVYDSANNKVDTLRYDASRSLYVSYNPLLFGTYTIRESSAPSGYVATNQTYTVTVNSETTPARISANNGIVLNAPITGGANIYKVDNNDNSLFLSGAGFTLFSDVNNNGVYDSGVDTVARAYDQSSGLMRNVRIIETTDSNGAPVYRSDLPLRYGSYLIVETVAPDGYGLDRNNNITHLVVNSSSVNIYIDNEEIGISTTLSSDAELPLSTELEEITLTDTVSYKGLDTASEYFLVGRLINKDTGEVMIDHDGEEIVSEISFTPSSSSGSVEVEFVVDSDLLFGNTVVCFEKLYLNEDVVVSHEDINDENQTVRFPTIRTNLYDSSTGISLVPSGDDVVLIDDVSYEGLVPGHEYEIRGQLVDLDGNVIDETVKTFEAEESSGNVQVEFEILSFEFDGQRLVAFEYLYDEELLIAKHEDINDLMQTIAVPVISTRADTEFTGHIVPYGRDIRIIDHVQYSGLIEDLEYELRAVLIDANTGESLIEDDSEIISSVTFTPEAGEGFADVNFTVDSNEYKGRTVVVFEYLYYGEELIAWHCDLEDTNQTVYFPNVETTATVGNNAKSIEDSDNVVITDCVSYENLEAGRAYLIRGYLMNTATNTPYLVDGNLVRSEVRFTPSSSSGTINISFSIDMSDIDGDVSLTVFEHLYDNEVGMLMASHCNINDRNQTVTVVYTPPLTPTPTPTATPTPTTPVVTTGEGNSMLSIIGLAVMAIAGGILVWYVGNSRKEND